MDRFKQLEKQVAELRVEVSELRKEIAELRAGIESVPAQPGAQSPSETAAHLHADAHPIESLLWQHGFPVITHGEHAQLVFPPNAHSGRLDDFYRLMRRYSFRLFMRDLIQVPDGSGFRNLTRYCSLKTVRYYMKMLAEIGIVSLDGPGYRLIRLAPSFGPTLEWFVCEIFRREFLAPALFNVRLRNTRHGGDYDVVSAIAGRLVYVEVKSSPPRGVEQQAVNAFLDRLSDLEPRVSVLFVDTELRMKDKLAPLLSEGLEREGKTGPQWAVTRLVNEIFHVGHSIYLTNSRKGVYTNLRTCFRDYMLWDRRRGTDNGRRKTEDG